MVVKLQSARFDNSAEPRLCLDGSSSWGRIHYTQHPGSRDGWSSLLPGPGFGQSRALRTSSGSAAPSPVPISWGPVLVAGEGGLSLPSAPSGTCSPLLAAGSSTLAAWQTLRIAPAKWSVPNRDILQPAERLRAAARNIWRLFPEFMQHMFSYKLNSEKMCIIIGWCSQQPSLLWITMTSLCSLGAQQNGLMQLETIACTRCQGLKAWPKASVTKSPGFLLSLFFPHRFSHCYSSLQKPHSSLLKCWYPEGGQMPLWLLSHWLGADLAEGLLHGGGSSVRGGSPTAWMGAAWDASRTGVPHQSNEQNSTCPFCVLGLGIRSLF